MYKLQLGENCVQTFNYPNNGVYLIDATPMGMMCVNDIVMLDSTETWTIVNNTNRAHPFHIHDTHFWVTEFIDNTTGQPIPQNEWPIDYRGPKDNVLVPVNRTVTFVAEFKDYGTPIAPENSYMFHCHILPHEDRGMMGQFVVWDGTIPSNECSDASDINDLFGENMGDVNTSEIFDNTPNTNEMSDPMDVTGCFYDDDGFQNSVWFTFTGDGGTYNISSVQCNATTYNSDTQVAIYSGDCMNPVFVDCQEDESPGGGLLNFNIDLETEDNVIYYMLVDGYGGSTGEFCVEVTNLMPNSVTNISQSDIEVFPNPTTGNLQINNVRPDKVELFDNTGRMVKSITTVSNSIDISDIAAGFYFLKIYEGDNAYSAKIIKE